MQNLIYQSQNMKLVSQISLDLQHSQQYSQFL